MYLNTGYKMKDSCQQFCVCLYMQLTSTSTSPFLAERVTNNLKELAQQVTPGDIVSTYGIRKAMGISIPLPDTEDSGVDLTDGEYPKLLGSI